MKRLVLAVLVATAFVVAAPAWAADPTTSGTATISNGVATLTSDFSDTSTANDFGALTFAVPTNTTFSQLQTLSAEYNITEGSCGGGSPRFQISIGGKNVFVYLGPSPTFTGCTTGWTSTGNLVGTSDACRVDTSQFAGGTQCSTWAQASALLGSQTVSSITFAVDGGWSQSAKKQVVQVRKVTINDQVWPSTSTGGPGGGEVNPAQLCKAQRTAMGSSAAFNELWGTNANARNAFGKCVSTVAHARNAGKTQQQILDAIAACKAQGKKGAALGSCVAATDGVAATKTEAQESRTSNGGHGKKKRGAKK